MLPVAPGRENRYKQRVLLTITTTFQPATDLGHLLRKHPPRVHSVDLSFGRAHVFYPEATNDRNHSGIDIMRSVLLGALAFFTVPTALGLLFTLASLFNRPLNKGTTTLDAFILPAYLLPFAMTFATVGFVIVTAAAPVWRRLTPKRAVLIAVPLGLTYPIIYLLGLVAGSVLMSRLHSPWLAAVLVYLVPGAVLGLAAILVAALMQRRSAKTP